MPASNISLLELRQKTLPELEAIYTQDLPIQVPAGAFRGHLLLWLDSPGARHPLFRPVTALMFQRLPFGVDFDRRCWFFVNDRIRAGQFTPVAGASRWHGTQTIGLHYQVSRLPGPLKGLLYDEVKPLGADLCLGIGGLVLSGVSHPIFFFALNRSIP